MLYLIGTEGPLQGTIWAGLAQAVGTGQDGNHRVQQSVDRDVRLAIGSQRPVELATIIVMYKAVRKVSVSPIG